MGTLLTHAVRDAAQEDADHEAFRFLDASLDYGRLEAKSNQLANLLVELGVRRGDRVGIYLNKSIEAPVAIYGIMKAGAAYVPLDPGAPAARLAGVLRHCDIRTLVSHPPKARDTAELLREEVPLRSIVGIAGEITERKDLDVHDWSALDAAAWQAPPDRSLDEHDLAYIMYTSGSTGEPKGIVHTHASGLAYARRAARLYEVSPQDRLSNHSPLHFDMSTFDYFAGPLGRATTVVISEAHARLPASLSQLVQDERLTIWYSVPFALIQLLLRGVLDGRDLSSLRWVLFGGEPFPPKYLHALMQRLPNARFANVYGPAEINQCTHFEVPLDRVADGTPVPIGALWDGAEAIVVDDADRDLPASEAGELLVRTPTMMRGYWDRPDLNERAFYRRPKGDGTSDVFYRTGDLVRYEDGLLVFLGRKDRQVKVRGHRVELDEIEAALASHSDVEEAAAYPVRTHASEGGSRIEAAVVSADPVDATLGARLRHHAGARLPAYATPTRIRILTTFPRTTSGKIDRRRLSLEASDEADRPAPDSAGAGDAGEAAEAVEAGSA